MLYYIAKRVLIAMAILAAISFFTYWIFFALSPDPAVLICGRTCTPERIDDIRHRLGVDQPLMTQYWDFLRGVFVGRDYGTGADAVHCGAPCLGYSFQTNQSVWDMIQSRLPVTITLAVGAAIMWLVVGVGAGLISGSRPGSIWDRGATFFALSGVSLPIYFSALVLQYILTVKLEVLPFPQAVPFSEDPGLWFQSYLMPWMVLALAYASIYARLTRSNVITTRQQNFYRTAVAKGAPPSVVLRRHVLRPATTPIITLLGMDLAGLLGGAVITESVFGLQGVGKLSFDSIAKNDQPVIMGVTLLAATCVVVGNIVVDVLYTAVDPRIKLTGGNR